MPNSIYIEQEGTNGQRFRRKITPVTGGEVIGFDATTKAATLMSSSALKKAVTAYSADGAITISDGVHKITKGSAAAMTLAVPTAAQEGTTMFITSQTAFAHTVTQASAGFNGGGAATDVGTFGGAVGDGMTIVAVNLKWNVQNLRNVTLA